MPFVQLPALALRPRMLERCEPSKSQMVLWVQAQALSLREGDTAQGRRLGVRKSSAVAARRPC